MASVAEPDPAALGWAASILLSLLFTAPLLVSRFSPLPFQPTAIDAVSTRAVDCGTTKQQWIFLRMRSRPSSFIWKAIYLPRTWWPGPRLRVHPVFDPVPGAGSPFKLLWMRFFRQSSPRQSSRQSSQHEHSPMADEEIHLRFLALCLRLALLALLLGLPTASALFIAGIPPEPTRTSALLNFTVLRLLYQYDHSPADLAPRLIGWAVSALLIGVVLAFLLILLEWHYLRTHRQRFSSETCAGLQIVYFPRKPHSGFQGVGEKKMANWVRACGLGPVGQEGSGSAIRPPLHKTPLRQQSSRQKYPRSMDRERQAQTHSVDPASLPLRTSAETRQHSPSYSEAPPLRSEQRGIIIQGIFTISQLESLYSLAEKRRKVLDDLELNEAKYVAGFLPEKPAEPSSANKAKLRDNRNHGRQPRTRAAADEDFGEEQVTPYGPLGLYKLDAKPREASGLGWDDPSLSLSRFESTSTLPAKLGGGAEESSQVGKTDFRFGEVIQDSHLANHTYQDKWAIGNQVTRQADGTFHNVTQGKPASLTSSQKSRHSDHESPTQAAAEPPQVVVFPSIESLGGSPRSLFARSRVGSSPAPGGSTPCSLASTDDTHGYPASTSTAPTSASLNHSNSKQTLRDNNDSPGPAVTLTDLIEQEAHSRTRLSFPSELTGNPRPFHPFLNQSASLPNLVRAPTPVKGNIDRYSGGSGIIPHLFELPETPTNQEARPLPMHLAPTNSNHSKTDISNPITKKGAPPAEHSGKVKPHRFMNAAEIAGLYHLIRTNRSQLKRLNTAFLDEKRRAVEEMEQGANSAVAGWILVGKGVQLIDGARPIDGMTREDVNWAGLGRNTRVPLFWILFLGIFLVVGILIVVVAALSMAALPELPNEPPAFALLRDQTGLQLGLISVTAPAILLFLLLYPSLSAITYLAKTVSGLPSKAAGQLLSVQAIFVLISGCFLGWFAVCASTLDLALHPDTEIAAVERLSRAILALADAFLSFQSLLAIVVPSLLLAQPGRSRKVKRALHTAQTPRQRVRSLWPQQMDSALCRGASLMAVSILLLFSSIAPLTILPSVVFFAYMIVVQQRNVHYVYKRDSQSGGKTELQMVFMLSLLLVLHSIFLAVILASRQRWALAALAGIIGCVILAMASLMVYQDSNMGDKRSLHPHSKRALEVFEAGPGAADYDKCQSGQGAAASQPAGSKKDSLRSVFQLVHSKLRSSEVAHHRPVPLPSESVDDLVDTRRALCTVPDAPPSLPFLSWGAAHVPSKNVLYPPVLLQTSPAVWLPRNGIAADEAHELKKYWDLDAFYEEGIPTEHLNLA